MMTNKVPTFQEWMAERDPEMNESLWKGAVGAAALAGGLWAGSNYLSKPSSTSAPVTPAAKVSTNTGVHKSTVTPGMPGGVDKTIQDKKIFIDDDGEVKPTKRPASPGGLQFGDRPSTVERPKEGTWVLTFDGDVSTARAVRAAKSFVQKELGLDSDGGLAADINKTPEGVSITIMNATKAQRDGVRRAMGN